LASLIGVSIDHFINWVVASPDVSFLTIKYLIYILFGMVLLSVIGGFYLKSESPKPVDKFRLLKFAGVLGLILMSLGMSLIWLAAFFVTCFMALGRSWDMLQSGVSKWKNNTEGTFGKKAAAAWTVGCGVCLLIATTFMGMASYYSNIYNICAATQEKDISVAAMYTSEGGDINYCDHHKRTPLHLAVATNHFDLVINLAKEKYLNAKDIYGETPLDWAIKEKNDEIIAFLKKAGAQTGDQSKKNKNKEIE